MTIQFSCEICGKSLSTTDDKAGRKAKCPGCGEMLVVPRPEGLVDPDDQLMTTVAEDENGAESAKGTMPCPMCGESVSANARKCEFCGETLKSPQSHGPRIVEFGDVFSTAWEQFMAKIGTAVVAQLVMSLLIFLSMIPGFGIFIGIMAFAEQNHREPNPVLFLWLIPAVIFTMAVVFFLTPGMAMLYLKIGRKEEVGLGTLFGGARYFVKSTLCSIAFGTIVMLGFIAFIIPGIILGLRYWPYLYVIVDEDPPGFECFSRSAQLTQGNWGSILLLGVAGFIINFIAQLVCGILQLVTQPLNTMLFATAYLKMSGQIR